MIRNSTPTSPTGNDVKIETIWAGNSVIDMTAKKAPIMIAKTVAVARIVCNITSRKACAVRKRSEAATTKVRKTPTDAASIGEKQRVYIPPIVDRTTPRIGAARKNESWRSARLARSPGGPTPGCHATTI